MIRISFYCIFAVAFCALLRADDPPKPASYEALIAQAKKGDTKVDFGRMRIAFTETKNYNPILIDETTNAMNAAFATLQYEAAAAAAEKVLEKKFVDLSARKIAAESYEELDKPEKAKFHRTIYNGLIQSILKSGDGKTQATAYVVIATDEEYELLAHLKLRSKMQGLIQEKGESYDRIDAVDPKTNKNVTIYFQVTIAFKAIEKAFRP